MLTMWCGNSFHKLNCNLGFFSLQLTCCVTCMSLKKELLKDDEKSAVTTVHSFLLGHQKDVILCILLSVRL